MSDVADRYLRDKTDAIADIIRNISEQCAAAVEGLHMAQDAEQHDEEDGGDDPADAHRAPSSVRDGSELGDGDGDGDADRRVSSIPPTPDLIHNRSSTSMSMISSSTLPERSSLQYGPGEIPTKIVEDDDEHAHETDGVDDPSDPGPVSKRASQDRGRTSTTRVVA
ncbi:hypothetical protein VTN02DRAFT_1125 [Thermoascus thermophilus]